MQLIDFLLIGLILLALGLAVRHIRKNPGKCSGCSGNCANCPHVKR